MKHTELDFKSIFISANAIKYAVGFVPGKISMEHLNQRNCPKFKAIKI